MAERDGRLDDAPSVAPNERAEQDFVERDESEASLGSLPSASDESEASDLKNARALRRAEMMITSEQVGGEHHVLELRQIETVEQTVVHVVHVRYRAIAQPRPLLVARQVAGLSRLSVLA